MAEMPVQADVNVDGPAIPGSNFIKGAVGMPVVRQITLLVALAGSVALAIFATTWMQTPDYRPVSGASNPARANEVIDALEASQIDYQLDQRTGMVLVPKDKYYSALMSLAGAEVLEGNQLGYELLDEEQGFGVSQFMENARHRRAVEGELAKHITSINAVAQARVLLATPKTSTFIRDRRKPSSSVTVTLKPGRSLKSHQIKGITSLVAAAVPELDPKDVVVIDQSGALLSANGDDPALERSQQDMAITRAQEQALYEKVANILGPMVGADRFTAEVNATLDFTRSEQSSELYNPDLVALRSEQRVEEEKVGTEKGVGGVPGTLSNEPPQFGEVEENAGEQEQTRSSSLRSTRNYEVDKTLSYTQHQIGTISRLSVAVVVDDRVVIDPESGESSSEAWSEEDLNDLTQSVQTAVGFRADRGDTVSVVNRPFYRAPREELVAQPMWEQTWFTDLLKQVLGGLAILLVIFGLLRPLYKNLSQAGEMVREQQSLAIADMTQMREAALSEAVPGLPSPILHDPDDSSAQKMETVRNLISEDPNRVAQVVKHWVNEDE